MKEAQQTTKNQEPITDNSSPDLENILLLARGFVHPEVRAAHTAHLWLHGGKRHPDPHLDSHIRTAILEEVSKACLADPEVLLRHSRRIAMAQAHTLDVLFHQLLNTSLNDLGSSSAQALIKLALRAQAQCHQTLQSIATTPAAESKPIRASEAAPATPPKASDTPSSSPPDQFPSTRQSHSGSPKPSETYPISSIHINGHHREAMSTIAEAPPINRHNHRSNSIKASRT
jgi:hypothetical protein